MFQDAFKNFTEKIFTEQTPVADHLVHYRNMFAAPEFFLRRKVDYSKMKVLDEKFRKESERFKTFENLTGTLNKLSYKLAKAGLFYDESKIIDHVTCIFCKGSIKDWNINDNPMKRHKNSYPTCPFVILLNVGNVPLVDPPSLNIDVDTKKFKDNPDVVIDNPPGRLHSFNIFEKINQMNAYWREETFECYEFLKHFAWQGLFVKTEENGNYLCCCWCDKSTEILNDVELLDECVFHSKMCIRNDWLKTETVIRSAEFCDVEFSVTTQEIEARMETPSIHVFLNKSVGKNKLSKECVRRVIEKRLKDDGRDFDSLYEFLTAVMLRSTSPEAKDLSGNEKSSSKYVPLSDYQCVVCLDKAVEVVFLPCGHFKTCDSCSKAMVTCPVCRVLIERRVKNVRFNT